MSTRVDSVLFLISLFFARPGASTHFVSIGELQEAARYQEPAPEILGELDPVLAAPLLEAAKAVGMIAFYSPRGSATGFLIDVDLLVTNHHVLASKEEARDAYLILGLDFSGAAPSKYRFSPDRIFLTNRELDITIVTVEDSPGFEWGFIPLVVGTPTVGEPAIIIQHAMGAPKTVVLRDNSICGVEPSSISYHTGTNEGSSGSPVFDSQLRLIAVHNEGGALGEDAEHIGQVQNKGTRIELVKELLSQ